MKIEDLRSYLSCLGNTAIAFSGGTDSGFLLKIAHDLLGEKVLAITVCSAFFPKSERIEAHEFCRKNSIRQIEIETDILSCSSVRKNPENRCYICKKEIFIKIKAAAAQNGFTAVCDGTNMDDEGDYRPGLKALLELGIKNPLRECRFSKSDIRKYSKEMGLNTWKKPSLACLATRIPYGEEITEKKLFMVEHAELMLHEMGFDQLRVRIYKENLARIEVIPSQMQKIFDQKEYVVLSLKKIGFTYVTLDLAGYRTGSMNEVLQ